MLRQLGRQSTWQVYDGKEWAPQLVDMWMDGLGGPNMQPRSTLPLIQVQDGRPVRGPICMAQAPGSRGGTDSENQGYEAGGANAPQGSVALGLRLRSSRGFDPGLGLVDRESELELGFGG